MHSNGRIHNSIFVVRWKPARATRAFGLSLLVPLFLFIIAAQSAQAQTYSVIYTFQGPYLNQDGFAPWVGLTADAQGNLYGTTLVGGGLGNCPTFGCGTAFQLTRTGSVWSETLIHRFNGGWFFYTPQLWFARTDGAYPEGRTVLGSDGALYGNTTDGASGGGTVYRLQPSSQGWIETVLYRFTGGVDGLSPSGDLAFDQSGDVYGTVSYGGPSAAGIVFRLQRAGSGWTKSMVYSFQGGADGAYPYGIIMDRAGSLYGSTRGDGASNRGTIYQLTPSGSGWTKSTLYEFQGGDDGGSPGALTLDGSGNLYGATCGSVFMLSPLGDTWTFHLLYSFTEPVCHLQGSLTLDAAGNLYGSLYSGGAYSRGAIFKLTPGAGRWTYSALHEFTGHRDGGEPTGSLVIDANGNLYGTTTYGGLSGYCASGEYPGCGVVWEIRP